MAVLQRVIYALLYLCCLAAAYFLIIWVLGVLGIMIPATILKIIMVMFVLVAILVLIRVFAGSGIQFWPPG